MSFTVTRGTSTELVLDTAFLKALFESVPVKMNLADEAAESRAPIDNIPHAVGSSNYLDREKAAMRPSLSLYKGCAYAVAHTAPTGAYFRNAVDAALTTVLALAAAGHPYSRQRLAVSLNLPQAIHESANASAAMSAVLGLYRVEAELGIPLSAGKLSTGAEVTAPEITVYSMASGKALPSVLTGAEHRLYCVTPEVDANGLPVFAKLRSFLDWLTGQVSRGAIKSARVFCRSTVADAIREMARPDLGYTLTDAVEADTNCLAVGLLIEAAEELNLYCVGTTHTREPEVAVPKATRVLPEKECLIASKKPHVTILARADDRAAQALAMLCTERGAGVYPFFTNCDPGEFSAAVLHSQTLIVCDGAEIPDSPFATFAAKTLSNAGGYLLFLGESQRPAYLNGFTLEDGISPAILDQICKK